MAAASLLGTENKCHFARALLSAHELGIMKPEQTLEPGEAFITKRKRDASRPVDVFQHFLEDLEEVAELFQTKLRVHGLRQQRRHDSSGHEAHRQALLLIRDHSLVDA